MRRIVVDFETGTKARSRSASSEYWRNRDPQATDECVEIEPLLVVSSNLVVNWEGDKVRRRVGKRVGNETSPPGMLRLRLRLRLQLLAFELPLQGKKQQARISLYSLQLACTGAVNCISPSCCHGQSPRDGWRLGEFLSSDGVACPRTG